MGTIYRLFDKDSIQNYNITCRKFFKVQVDLFRMQLSACPIIDIPLEKIALNKSQARQRDTTVSVDDDLVSSIRKDGSMTPIIVKKLENGTYDLLVGQRIFKAHKILKLDTIKSRVVDRNLNDFESKKISFIENITHKDVKHADLVDCVGLFMERYNDVKTVAEELGISQSTVKKYVSTSHLPEKIKNKIKDGSLVKTHVTMAIEALGGDESKIDVDLLLETAEIMKEISPQARKNYIEIQHDEPELSPSSIKKRATRQVMINKITIDVTNDQCDRIDDFKNVEGINKIEDAVVELIDKGLDVVETEYRF